MKTQLVVAILMTVTVCAHTRAQQPAIDFEKQVAPILAQHCVGCHSAGISKGGISLETIADLQENGYLVAGSPQDSYLIELVSGTDDQPPAMPQENQPLSQEQVALLSDWITAGAHWPENVVVKEKSKADASWWAYQPLADHQTLAAAASQPQVTKLTIDDFIAAKLDSAGLKSNPPADRRTLIRRATYDLLGLPPTPAEVDAFENDPDPNAYSKLIDRLLDSPHYGERWGRHWLDVVRFGESNGFERNVIINDLWPFRDYVIRSLNQDRPFDQVLREHLAGDLIAADDRQRQIGVAFLVAGPYDNVGNQDAAAAAQIKLNTIDEMIRATSAASLGLTLGCARCHDHKFDPITQEDYYGWYATFAGVVHGSQTWATEQQKSQREQQLKELQQQQSELQQQQQQLIESLADDFLKPDSEYARESVNARQNTDQFPAVEAKFIRFKISASHQAQPCIDELEIYGPGQPDNLALASTGAKATASSVYPNSTIHRIEHLNDGQHGNSHSWISQQETGWAMIELPKTTTVNRVVWGRDREEKFKDRLAIEYSIQISTDGETWTEVAHGRDRKPANPAHRDYRVRQIVKSMPDQANQIDQFKTQLEQVRQKIAAVPPLPTAWLGSRRPAAGPFHVFIGGSPQRSGVAVTPSSLTAFADTAPSYQVGSEATEADRRKALAEWITDPGNPLTPRVLANRLWQHHFGTGIVDTPNDFGYMGGRPTHPELLDFLAGKLLECNWRLKPLHRLIMNSQTYQQASAHRVEAATIDADSRLLWRFPPRRLSAEELRDTLLQLAGKLDRIPTDQTESLPAVPDGGPGFRLYEYQQDNVATYVPLNQHGPETYRRAVYHQNARASVVDLMAEFDQPDCAFSAPRRAETTTPLQALTLMNHSFTLDMAAALAERLKSEAGDQSGEQIQRAYQLCFSRTPTQQELDVCQSFYAEQGPVALCRVLLNTSELIYVE